MATEALWRLMVRQEDLLE